MRWFALLSIALVTGCGKEGAASVDECDGGPAASSTGGFQAQPSECPPLAALWVASDWSSSAVGSLALSGAITSTTGRVDLGADPTLAFSRGRAFLVAEDQDAIFELDPSCGTPKRKFNAHMGGFTGSSNPQDVGVASDGSLWIPLYNMPRLLVLASNGCASGSIDLSSYEDGGNPLAMGIAISELDAGEKAFVPLQRLNNQTYAPDQPSWMLRIDVPTAKVEAHIVLAGRNPFGMIENGSDLWLADPGSWDADTEPFGGVERFDVNTSTTSLVIHEADLGGSVAEVGVSGACGVAIVADTTTANATSLVTFNASTGAPILPASRSPLATEGYDLWGLAFVSDTLLVGDRRRAANGYPIHVFDMAADCTLSERRNAIFLPLPPVAIRTPQ